MREPCRRPKLLNLACWLYGAVVWTYPSELQHDFGRELRITFRNRAEDVLRHPGLAPLLAFAFHIASDWIRTLAIEPGEAVPVSVRGLGRTDACGSLDRSTMSVGLLLATLGVCLMVSGWYGWLHYEASFPSRYSYSTIAIGRHQRLIRVLRPHETSPSLPTDRPRLNRR
jgi:hypothetical protein